jgi:hypothetical protein
MWKQLENPNGEHRDMVICSVPWTDTEIPLMAPGALKSIAEGVGVSCWAIDLNAEMYNYSISHQHKDKFIKFFFDEIADEEIEFELRHMFQTAAEQILSFTPTFVGISLFSYVCQTGAKWLAYYLKKLNPNVTIIFGGPGCLVNFTGPALYIDDLQDTGLVDFHVRGDGEHALRELLTGNSKYPGVNDVTWQNLTNEELNLLPYPDYDNYKFDLYQLKALPLMGSRGCVRQCTFCDFIINWKKFQWRTAENIFEELLIQNKKYQINNFKFQDALTNGNMKEFVKLLELLADHNDQNPDATIVWSGYYIFRNQTSKSDYEWDLLERSGARFLQVGIENLNQHIRYAMGKHFSDEAIIYHLRKAKQHKIHCVLLNIVGYINETQQDIDKIKKWLVDNTEFKDIITLQWGGSLGIFPNTYLDNNKKELGITMIGRGPQQWTSSQTDSTPTDRARWVNELYHFSKELGYDTYEHIDNHFLLETLLKQ